MVPKGKSLESWSLSPLVVACVASVSVGLSAGFEELFAF